MFNFEFQTDVEKNVITEPMDQDDDCAAQCFNKGGCSAFFQIDNECHQIIGINEYGTTNIIENENVEISGILTDFCPNSAFTGSYKRKSLLYCLTSIGRGNGPPTAIDEVRIYDYIIENNPIVNVWNIDDPTGSPLEATSKYTLVEFADEPATVPDYRWFKFTFETHVRTGNTNSGRRRRSSSQDAVEEMLRLENESVSNILSNFVFPPNFTVPFTSPVYNHYARQIGSDGSIVADCSSGSCQCSSGYADHGNGCVAISSDQISDCETVEKNENEIDSNNNEDSTIRPSGNHGQNEFILNQLILLLSFFFVLT